MGEVTRFGVKRIGSGVQKLNRRMGRTYQKGWEKAKSNVNRSVPLRSKDKNSCQFTSANG